MSPCRRKYRVAGRTTRTARADDAVHHSRFAVAAQICDRVAVMQTGVIVEGWAHRRGVRGAAARLYADAAGLNPRTALDAAGGRHLKDGKRAAQYSHGDREKEHAASGFPSRDRGRHSAGRQALAQTPAPLTPHRGGTLTMILQPEPAILNLGINQQTPVAIVATKITQSLLRYDSTCRRCRRWRKRGRSRRTA